jgi:hypothetical protein
MPCLFVSMLSQNFVSILSCSLSHGKLVAACRLGFRVVHLFHCKVAEHNYVCETLNTSTLLNVCLFSVYLLWPYSTYDPYH